MWLLCPRDCDLTSNDARVGVVCAVYRLVFVDFGTIKDKKKKLLQTNLVTYPTQSPWYSKYQLRVRNTAQKIILNPSGKLLNKNRS